MKMVIAGLAALFVSGTAVAQGGGGGQRRPEAEQPSVPPIRVQPRAAPTTNLIAPALVPENTWVLDLSNGGRVLIQLRPDQAPNHVERIKALTRRGFYNGLIFHRVIEGFMAQGGDPTGTGTGQSDLPDMTGEFNDLPHLRGAVAMARATDPNSANSQFYVMFVPRLGMDREYTVFGRVVAGMNHVDTIERGQPPANPTRIVRASIGADNVPPPTPEEVAAANRAAQPAAPPLRVLDVPSLTGSGGAAPAPAPAPTPAPAQSPPPATPPSGANPTPQP
jgi:peptidylprolyl isomerase